MDIRAKKVHDLGSILFFELKKHLCFFWLFSINKELPNEIWTF